MTLLYSDPVFLEHDTGPRHPERAERLVQVVRHLQRTGLDTSCERPTWHDVTLGQLARLHGEDYVESLRAYAQQGGGRIEVDTVVCDRSYQVGLRAAGAVCDAVHRVTNGEGHNALCLVRPPGHHALPNHAMGFCLFNNVAVGAATALAECRLDRVLIVDWDVHHGNGTQEMFWTSPQVGFLSIHRWPFYPGTGDRDETGAGDGLSTTHNVPVKMGTTREAYLDAFRGGLETMAARMQPQLILVSAGFDSHRDDPVGSLGLETEDFGPLTEAILQIADVHCQGRLVSVLEGGYNTGVLAGCVELHLSKLLRASEGAATPSN